MARFTQTASPEGNALIPGVPPPSLLCPDCRNATDEEAKVSPYRKFHVAYKEIIPITNKTRILSGIFFLMIERIIGVLLATQPDILR